MARTSSTKTGLSFPREQREELQVKKLQDSKEMQQWFDFKTVGVQGKKETKKQRNKISVLIGRKSFGIYLEEFLSSHDWFNTTLSPWIRVICSISISSLRFWDQERKERKWRSFFKVEKEKTTCELCIHSVTLEGDVSRFLLRFYI